MLDDLRVEEGGGIRNGMQWRGQVEGVGGCTVGLRGSHLPDVFEQHRVNEDVAVIHESCNKIGANMSSCVLLRQPVTLGCKVWGLVLGFSSCV